MFASSIFTCLFLVVFTQLYDLKKCNLHDPKLQQCLIRSVSDALNHFKKGNVKLGLPPLDPLDIPMMTIKPGKAVQIKTVYKNVKLYGFCSGNITNVVFDLSKGTLTITANYPLLKQVGHYEGNGKFLLLPAYGNGTSEIRLEKVKAVFQFSFTVLNDFLRIGESELKLEPNFGRYHFENMFNGNRELGDVVHKVGNENWRLVFDDTKEQYEKIFATVFVSVANRLFEKMPLSQLFL